MRKLLPGGSRNNGSKGAVFIEAAIAIPILVLIVAFLLEVIRFSVVAFVASEIEVSSARMISLPPSPSDHEKVNTLCSELVGREIEKKFKLFHVPLTPEDYKVHVKVINSEIAEIYATISSSCAFCLSELGGDIRFIREISTDTKLEAGIPPCEPDEWEYS